MTSPDQSAPTGASTQHPAITAADEATAFPRHALLWAVLIVSVVAFASVFIPWGFAHP